MEGVKGNFACSFCEKVFVKGKALKNHVQFTHENPKIFLCKKCDKSFTSKNRLKQHGLKVDCTKSKSVKERKTFVCHLCEEMFHKLSKLKVHINSAHKQEKLAKKKTPKKKKQPTTTQYFESDEDAETQLKRMLGDSEREENMKETWK